MASLTLDYSTRFGLNVVHFMSDSQVARETFTKHVYKHNAHVQVRAVSSKEQVFTGDSKRRAISIWRESNSTFNQYALLLAECMLMAQVQVNNHHLLHHNNNKSTQTFPNLRKSGACT